MSYGFELLAEQVVSSVSAYLDYLRHHVDGDSEIEKLFIAALLADQTILAGIDRKYVPQRLISNEKGPPSDDFGGDVFIRQQENIDGIGRVDFIIYMRAGEKKWRKLIIECDGHDFHERTKEQAANDRSRDRAALLAGYEFMRFTGSELWRDPLGCALQVRKWLLAGANNG